MVTSRMFGRLAILGEEEEEEGEVEGEVEREEAGVFESTGSTALCVRDSSASGPQANIQIVSAAATASRQRCVLPAPALPMTKVTAIRSHSLEWIEFVVPPRTCQTRDII